MDYSIKKTLGGGHMGKFNIFIQKSHLGKLKNERYTLEELNEKMVLLEDGKVLDVPSFREENDAVYYRGNKYLREDYFMYLPKSVPGALNYILAQGKYIYVDDMMLVRSQDTGMKWYQPSRRQSVYIRKPGEFVEMICFSEKDLSIKWRRITGTEDADKEVPNISNLQYIYKDGQIAVTGASRFCERIHVPAEINGIPVRNVSLKPYRHSRFLREIVVEEGVETVHMSFDQSYLETIDIPETVQIEGAPDEIYNSLWFQKQPDGPVYFHDWFCGIKGTFTEDILTIREGTKGIICFVPLSANIKKIILPKSLKVIGRQEFWDCENLEEIVVPEMEDGIKTYFWGTTKEIPFSEIQKGVNWKEKLCG